MGFVGVSEHMGQTPDVSGVGLETVYIGNSVVLEIGGSSIGSGARIFSFSELVSRPSLFSNCFAAGAGNPVMTGGGSSRPSFALRDSCLAKSDACHHSKNFKAKIDVGSNIFNEPANQGPVTCVKIRLLKIELVWPGRAAVVGAACVANAMAL